MKTNTDNINIYFAFIMSLGFMICLLAIVSVNKENKNLQTQIDELRVLFNQKFLQEMAVSEPEIRDLTYRKVGSTKNIQKFEF
jgi:hypothetical protein